MVESKFPDLSLHARSLLLLVLHMVTPLDRMTLFIFFLEVWEVAANWVFQAVSGPQGIHDNLGVSSWLQAHTYGLLLAAGPCVRPTTCCRGENSLS